MIKFQSLICLPVVGRIPVPPDWTWRLMSGLCAVIGILAAPCAQAETLITGAIIEMGGVGISGVPIAAEVWTPDSQTTRFLTTTDADGRFVLPGVVGRWTITSDAGVLNGRGFLALTPAGFTVSNAPLTFRLMTRRLDLDHRLRGMCRDELGLPVSLAVRASMVENGQAFETNQVLASDGAFDFVLSPGIWRLEAAVLTGGLTGHFFPELSVSLEPTQLENQVSVVAPRITGNIALTVTNLIGFEIVVETRMFGARYVWSTPVYSNPTTVALPVFNGVWTVSARESGGRLITRDPTRYQAPAPVDVAVTNGAVQRVLAGVPDAGALLRSVYVLLIGLDREPLQGVSVMATSDDWGYAFPATQPPPPGGTNAPGTPPGAKLSLRDGLWTISASAYSYDSSYLSWQASRRVRVKEAGISNVTLLLPANGVGPRIRGRVLQAGSAEPAGGASIHISGFLGETNYSGWVRADADGRFSTPTLPGRWTLSAADGTACEGSSEVAVGLVDEFVEFSIPSRQFQTNAPLTVTVVNDQPGPANPAALAFLSWVGFGAVYSVGSEPTMLPLGVGLWNVALFPGSIPSSDPYRPAMALRIQHEAAGQLTLVERSVTGRIEGRLRDSVGRLITNGYATAWAMINGTNYVVTGEVSSGYFSLNVVPGCWEVKASTSRYPSASPTATVGVAARPGGGLPPATIYLDPDPQVLCVTAGVTRCEFTLAQRPPSVTLSVAVLHEDGRPVDGAVAYLSGTPAGGSRELDEEGKASVLVAPGALTITAQWKSGLAREALLFPVISAELNAPSNHIVLVARPVTQCIAGSVRGEGGRPIRVPVSATAWIRGTNYLSAGCDNGEEFCLPVMPGTWEVHVAGRLLNDLGYRSVAPRITDVAGAGAVPRVEFSVSRFTGDFRRALWSAALSPGSDTTLTLELSAEADLPWKVEASEDLHQWNRIGVVETTYGLARMAVPVSGAGGSRFYRAVALE